MNKDIIKSLNLEKIEKKIIKAIKDRENIFKVLDKDYGWTESNYTEEYITKNVIDVWIFDLWTKLIRHKLIYPQVFGDIVFNRNYLYDEELNYINIIKAMRADIHMMQVRWFKDEEQKELLFSLID